jgi:hypothetical protein
MSDYNSFFSLASNSKILFIPAVLWDLDLGQESRIVTALMIRNIDADVFQSRNSDSLSPKNNIEYSVG